MQGVSFRKQPINLSALFPLQFHTMFDSRSHAPISLFWLKIWVQTQCSAAAVSFCSERPLDCVHTAPTQALVGQLAFSRTSPVSPWSRQAVFPQPMLRSPILPPVLTAVPWSSWTASYPMAWEIKMWAGISSLLQDGMQLTGIAIPVSPAVWLCAVGAGSLLCDSVRNGMGWLEVHSMWPNRQLGIYCLLSVF